ncbi:P-loop NTPase fold protein [Streptomyces sp. ZAF1911]|uniref:P-loop NTPase fold protein n=1 Tax=Streptomyces sp. ZAF1911 TaxID=2944129 RepID=UPI00237C399A|nr:P-loop NTPase fold protein [Streptomyces sp. ZAF1911]MDD9376891.1 P-loop NTPase fold protein [Streptomyces sp. ZAF1911]
MSPEQRWTLEDTAIADSGNDRFDHYSVAKQLGRIIRSSETSLAIGLIGPFGSGKSSVVQMLRSELSGPDWAVLHVSAEHHSGVARARGLIYALLDDARRLRLIESAEHESARTTLEGGHQRTMSREDRNSGKTGKNAFRKYRDAACAGMAAIGFMLAAVWLIGVIVVAGLHRFGGAASVPAGTWFAANDATRLTTILFSAAVIAAVLNAGKEVSLQALKAYEITVTTPRPEATDELERAFTRLLEKIKKKRVVIAVDDIDRLGADHVLDALATVRSLLLTGTNHRLHPVFVLSCDEDIVREAIVGIRPGLAHRPASASRPTVADSAVQASGVADGSASRARDVAARKATEEAAQEYLNKLFTVRVVLPAHHDTDLRTYAEDLLLNGPQQHPAVALLGGPANLRTLLEVLIHRDVQDPRHVIRLLNSFFTNYDLARHREATPERIGKTPRIARGEVTGYPVELARLTVLRHDFRALYDSICAEHSLLHLLDDALLGDERAMRDPLLHDFMFEGAVKSRIDLRIPGLSFLNATVRRAKTQRPPRIGPLLSLGSTQASRLLGSEMATAIESEMVQGDSAAFAERLREPGGRERVLAAATATLDAARPGLDRDNALVAVVEGLAQVPALTALTTSDEDFQALRTLTDRIARMRGDMTLPLPSLRLVPLLDLTDDPHLPHLVATLKIVPLDALESRRWAVALLTLPPGAHATALAPAVVTYFERMAEDDTNLDTMNFWNSGSEIEAGALPLEAFGSLFRLAARHEDPDALRRSGRLALEAADKHGWDGVIIKALLACLVIPELAPAAVEILTHTAPDEKWGQIDDPPGYTVATEIVRAVSGSLLAKDEEAEMLATASLLLDWLPSIAALPDPEEALDAVVTAVASSAGTNEAIATVAGEVLLGLPERHAASLARVLSGEVADHRSEGDPIGVVLRESLIRHLLGVTEESPQSTLQAATECARALTVDLEVLDAGGHFVRMALGRLMTAHSGRAIALDLAQRLIAGVENQRSSPQVEELLSSLHLLFRDPKVREGGLPRALQAMNVLISSNRVQPGVSFAAHYMGETALDGSWLHLFASHWGAVPAETHALLVEGLERPDAASSPLTAQLIDFLITTDEPDLWRLAVVAWGHATADAKSSLLAKAQGRAPGLAGCAATADVDLLCAALNKSGPDITETLQLMREAEQANAAIVWFIDRSLVQPQWAPELVVSAVVASTAPEELWSHLLPQMTEDQTTAARVAVALEALMSSHPESFPADLVDSLYPILRDAHPKLARAIGRVFASEGRLGDKLRKRLNGQSNSPEERARNQAFKEGREG